MWAESFLGKVSEALILEGKGLSLIAVPFCALFGWNQER